MRVHLTREQARAHDRWCMQSLGMPGIVLMENAARGCADAAIRMLPTQGIRRVTIVCGSGQNGGDGYAIARHLAIAGCEVRLVALGIPAAGSDADTMRRIDLAMGLVPQPWDAALSLRGADLVVDAVLGTGLERMVSGAALEAIRAMRDAGVPVLSVDLPSGMDADTGEPRPECVRATVTATMAAPKAGFARAAAAIWLGRVEIVDLGAPPPRG